MQVGDLVKLKKTSSQSAIQKYGLIIAKQKIYGIYTYRVLWDTGEVLVQSRSELENE